MAPLLLWALLFHAQIPSSVVYLIEITYRSFDLGLHPPTQWSFTPTIFTAKMASFIHCIILTLCLILYAVHAAPTTPAPSATPNPFHLGLLAAHNNVRVAHGASPLKWSRKLASMAAEWANNCLFENTNGMLSPQPYGENLAAGTGDFNAEAAVALFTQDKRMLRCAITILRVWRVCGLAEYDPLNPSYNHFTQVVWGSTTSLGCAVAKCNNIFPGNSNATYYVCLYDPPGNVIGQASYVYSSNDVNDSYWHFVGQTFMCQKVYSFLNNWHGTGQPQLSTIPTLKYRDTTCVLTLFQGFIELNSPPLLVY